ncbi:MAG: hypothetical protein AAFR71_10690 [Pseudomonadota bacterium]
MNGTFIAKAVAILAIILTVSACNSTDDTLTVGDGSVGGGPGTSAPNPAGVTNQLPSQQPPGTTSTPAPAAATTGQPQVYFAPVVGAPVDKVTALSQRLSVKGPEQGIQLLPSRLPTVSHEVRGYFSAISANGNTIVTHVWDVFSPSGERIHRIQSQETVSGSAADPWSVVPTTTMELIADKVLGSYVAWRATQT